MSNKWLYNQLKGKQNINVEPGYNPLINIIKDDGSQFRIYTPNSDEYIISIDLVQKVEEIGGDILSYPAAWCRSSMASKNYGEENGVLVFSHSELFSFLDD